MSDSGDDPEDQSDDSSSSMWLKTGVAAGLGFEFVGLVLAGALIGTQIDTHFDSSPAGLLVSMGLALVAAGWHCYLVSQRLMRNDE